MNGENEVKLEIHEWQDSDSGVWSAEAYCADYPNLKGRGDSVWEAIEHLARQIVELERADDAGAATAIEGKEKE